MMSRRSNGFTLLEAVTVMAVLTTMVIAVPPMLQWMRRQGVGYAAAQLQTELRLARMMAINRQTTCTMAFNRPGGNQYQNLLDGRLGNLLVYRGGVHFMAKGPDGKKMAEEISFNGRGMSVSVSPADIFLADESRSRIYRLRVLLPGGISCSRWQADQWQLPN